MKNPYYFTHGALQKEFKIFLINHIINQNNSILTPKPNFR